MRVGLKKLREDILHPVTWAGERRPEKPLCVAGDHRVNTIKRKIWVIFHLSGRVLKDPL